MTIKLTIEPDGRKPITVYLEDDGSELKDPREEQRRELMAKYRNIINELAQAAIEGVFEDGLDRVNHLGSAYSSVQQRINEIVGHTGKKGRK